MRISNLVKERPLEDPGSGAMQGKPWARYQVGGRVFQAEAPRGTVSTHPSSCMPVTGPL